MFKNGFKIKKWAFYILQRVVSPECVSNTKAELPWTWLWLNGAFLGGGFIQELRESGLNEGKEAQTVVNANLMEWMRAPD